MDILQLGTGLRPIEGAINHDRTLHSPHIDIAHDLNIFPYPWGDEQFDLIVAHDVFEHTQIEKRLWLNECWRMLRAQGTLNLRLPNWNNDLVHTDPTHYWYAHINMFDFWDPETDWWKATGHFYFQDDQKWWTVYEKKFIFGKASIEYRLRKLA